MEAAETSWTNYPYNYITTTYVPEAESYSEQSEDDDVLKAETFSIDSVLPDDLLERILSFLPIASVFRAGTVCKRWNDIVSSRRFLSNNLVSSQKPWYFMFTSSDEPSGYAYDPVIRKWYGGFDLPCIETSNWFVASSCGLVCFMDNDSRNKIYVSNPITKQWRRIIEPPGHKSSDYTAMSVNRTTNRSVYTVSVVKSKQVPGNFFHWDISIHVYRSETMNWKTTVTDVLTGWRGGDECVICDNTLYFLIYSTGGGGGLDHRHGLISSKLDSINGSSSFLMKSFIPMPCSITCGRLMNLKEKVVIVGGIGKHDRPEIIKGIGIWVLKNGKWEEMARMPQRFFQGFGEFDDVFASSGFDDLVYIQSYGSPALLTFDMNLKYWKWSQKCPVSKRFPLQLFTGFCFEPRLEIAP